MRQRDARSRQPASDVPSGPEQLRTRRAGFVQYWLPPQLGGLMGKLVPSDNVSSGAPGTPPVPAPTTQP